MASSSSVRRFWGALVSHWTGTFSSGLSGGRRLSMQGCRWPPLPAACEEGSRDASGRTGLCGPRMPGAWRGAHGPLAVALARSPDAGCVQRAVCHIGTTVPTSQWGGAPACISVHRNW
eukprot:2786215-Alexandrium_andersonii.AAC.1